MPVLPMRSLERRDLNPGQTFSIIFAIVAFLVVFGCLILVIVLSKFRKKPRDIPPSRHPVVPNYPHPFGPPPTFPSHPALLRGLRGQPTSPVEQYNPRVESPFPNSGTELDRFDNRGQYAGQNHGRQTTSESSLGLRGQQQDLPLRKLLVNGQSGEPDPRKFTTFSTKHDYILPVPAPLVLKARPAGRPPPLTRQLQRFPMPLSLTACRKQGLVHPAKFFQDLEQRNSSETTETFGTPCPVPQKPKPTAPVDLSLMDATISSASPAQDTQDDLRKVITSEADPSLPAPLLQMSSSDDGKAQKKSYHQKRLVRMGTMTRPKTPVAEIRSRFDAGASNATSRRPYTPASNPFTTPGFASTPPTSPEASAEKFLLPSTPPRPDSALPGMRFPSEVLRRTPSSVILPAAEKYPAPATPSKRTRRAMATSPVEKMSKKKSHTERFKLVSWSKLRPNVQVSRRNSSSSLSTILRPMLGPRSLYGQGASSVYSGEAKHLSFLEAIDLPMKGDPTHRTELARAYDAPSVGRSPMLHKRSTSIDHFRVKIDNWDLHTDDLDRSMLPPSSVKRSISDTGPRRRTLETLTPLSVDNFVPTRCLPLIKIGRSSDDVFGIEADGFHGDQADILMKRMDETNESTLDLSGPRQGTAPGGGDWI